MTEIEAIKAIKKSRPTSRYVIFNEALSIAIKALEKQIPKKVITPPCNTCENELCDLRM